MLFAQEFTPLDLPLPHEAKLVLAWFEHQPVFGGLLALMILDILVGVCLSIVKKTLSSVISWRGMSRKVVMLLMVGLSGILQTLIPTMPLLNLVSMFYTLTEVISILENAAACGVPLPAGLITAMVKLRQQQQFLITQKLPPTGAGQTTNITNVTVQSSKAEDTVTTFNQDTKLK